MNYAKIFETIKNLPRYLKKTKKWKTLMKLSYASYLCKKKNNENTQNECLNLIT